LAVDSVRESSPNAPVPHPPPLILASTSVYRRELLERLRLPFTVESPGVDERAPADEPAGELALRLALAKASAVAKRRVGSLVLGSDQVAQLGRKRLGKPGGRPAAIAQLEQSSGQTVEFVTAVCLHDSRDGSIHTHLDRTRVRFRRLSAGEIERYVDADQPFDCAGGFRCETLGIALFEAIESQDPTALIGLPLITTARLLREAGLIIP
jgi:septum formation protein